MGSASSCYRSHSIPLSHAPDVSHAMPHSKWSERVLCEIGNDPLSVTRDFPRIHVFVSTPKHNNYCTASHEETSLAVSQPLLAQWQRTKGAVTLLMELCNERPQFGAVMDAVWEKTPHACTDNATALLDVLLTTGMMRQHNVETHEERKTQSERCKTEVGPIRGYGSTSDTPHTFTAERKVHYTVHSKTLRVMQYMVQSVVFFSTQWVTSALHPRWCRHMQDILWTVHVYTETVPKQETQSQQQQQQQQQEMNIKSGEEAEKETRLVVLHKQTLRHYVDPRERRHTPRFEVFFNCTIRINASELLRDTASPPVMGENAEVERIDAEIVAARVEVPPKSFCWKSKLWVKRRDELARLLRENFQVELEEVKTLQER